LKYVTDPVKIRALLSKCPSLEAKLENLTIELQVLYKQGTGIIASSEEIMEIIALGYNTLSNMPHSAPNPGDKMNGIIANYPKVLGAEYDSWMKSVRDDMFLIGSVVKKIDNVIQKLPIEQQEVLSLKYWKKRTWDQIQDSTRLSKKQVKSYHRAGIGELCKTLEISVESYDACMEQLDGKEE